MEIQAELQRARGAQVANNPGQARVCARRAAGWAIREWYSRRDAPTERLYGDAMHQLWRVRADAAVPEAVRQAALRLTTKVDADHQLPFDNDPIEDARIIIAFAASP